MLVDLNGYVKDRMRVGITGAFGVPGEKDEGRRVIDFCVEKELSVSNT